jgi:AcrR family transcriptional regulator
MVLSAREALTDEEARTRALNAADALITERGVKSVGVDDVRDAAGVSLKRLYKLYASKEQLAEEALDRSGEAFLDSLRAYVESKSTAEEKLLAVFDFLAQEFVEPDYRGCPFVRAFDEMKSESPGVVAAVERQKRGLRDFISHLVEEAGKPTALADYLNMLANGAMVTAAILDGDRAAADAKTAAEALIAAVT